MYGNLCILRHGRGGLEKIQPLKTLLGRRHHVENSQLLLRQGASHNLDERIGPDPLGESGANLIGA
jgi:hypothetical protein